LHFNASLTKNKNTEILSLSGNKNKKNNSSYFKINLNEPSVLKNNNNNHINGENIKFKLNYEHVNYKNNLGNENSKEITNTENKNIICEFHNKNSLNGDCTISENYKTYVNKNLLKNNEQMEFQVKSDFQNYICLKNSNYIIRNEVRDSKEKSNINQNNQDNSKIDISSMAIQKRMINTFNSLDNKCNQIEKALNLEKVVFKENKSKEKMKRIMNEDPEINKIIISDIEKNKKQKFAFVDYSNTSNNQFVKLAKGPSFLDVMEYSDKINKINNNTIFKFKNIVLNKVPNFNADENKKMIKKQERYNKYIQKIENNEFLMESLRHKINLKRKEIMG
jgi:hypothetical protein